VLLKGVKKVLFCYLNGAVVLVDLDAQLAAGGEVVWLRNVSLNISQPLTTSLMDTSANWMSKDILRHLCYLAV
jgi:hypothetical protein